MVTSRWLSLMRSTASRPKYASGILFAATFSPLSFVGLPREAAYDHYHLYLAILCLPLVASPLAG